MRLLNFFSQLPSRFCLVRVYLLSQLVFLQCSVVVIVNDTLDLQMKSYHCFGMWKETEYEKNQLLKFTSG